MADNYDDYSKDQLVRLLRERDQRSRFGLVWERDEIDHDLSVNNDFGALLAQRLTDPRVAFEPIPAFLVNRFGARAGTVVGGKHHA